MKYDIENSLLADNIIFYCSHALIKSYFFKMQWSFMYSSDKE